MPGSASAGDTSTSPGAPVSKSGKMSISKLPPQAHGSGAGGKAPIVKVPGKAPITKVFPGGKAPITKVGGKAPITKVPPQANAPSATLMKASAKRPPIGGGPAPK